MYFFSFRLNSSFLFELEFTLGINNSKDNIEFSGETLTSNFLFDIISII